MPRDIPISNGQVLIAFDKGSILRELYYPYVGEENHSKGEPFRFGVWADDSLSWIPDGWEVKRNYLGNSLVTNVELANKTLQLQIIVNDLIDITENIYLKKITVKNLRNEKREIQLFFAHDFYIYGTDIGDTAAFQPENKSLIHYKKDRYFLINIRANNTFGLDFFATGNKEAGSQKGTWRDAEDGILSGNPIAQGSVDSIIAIPLTVPPLGEESCFYWIAMGKSWEEVKHLHELVKKKTPEELLKRTKDYWELWINQAGANINLLPKKVSNLYKKSLLICRTQINRCGSIIAGNDSDTVQFNRDTYSYMWPRDGALVAYALDKAGYNSAPFYLFCTKILKEEGYFLHKYTPSGALGSSWHSWLKEGKPQLPIQEDETALVIWALWKHYEIYKDLDLIQPLYEPLIKQAANFMMNYRDFNTGLPLPSFDLWEERQGIFTFTTATVYGGLMAAAQFATAFGETSLAKEYRNGAQQIREAMDFYLYRKEEGRFARMIYFKKDGSLEVDVTIDASLYGTFAFGAYEPDHPFVQSTMAQIREKLLVKETGKGIARYENDAYYRDNDTSNPWFVTTLWMAQYDIASAKNQKDLDKALLILEWVADHALPSGVLAEQIHSHTLEPISVSPLTWSHGTFIAAVQEYLDKLIV
ncbi:MAG: glycoside hydrolase family 15 protein [Chlamydiales bacterium]|nr:glycoside hydrolase family 15 protein [Chlamydiales bacterium]